MEEETDLIQDLEPEREKSLFRRFLDKTYILLVVGLLLFLMLAYIPGFHVLNKIAGRIVSSRLQTDYTFPLQQGEVVKFSKAAYDTLLSLYLGHQRTEIKVCLLGEKRGKEYQIHDLYVPQTFQKDVFSVTASLCNESTIVSLHTHPYLSCIFSNQDIRSYQMFKKINPEGIIGLMCAKDSMTFYGTKTDKQE